jgi:aryl-alcohol dehydrogenase-like predicted oxidoreductase
MLRRLGRSGIEVSAVGLGGWAIGGPFDRTDGVSSGPMGWGQVDDAESIRAIHRALELGVTFFDTANNYGAGHSERILGQALGSHRHEVVIATKFGSSFDETSRTHFDNREFPATKDALREACEGSLRRLNADYLDLYQFHAGGYEPEAAAVVRDLLEDLVAEGKIRWYGWSTDDPERSRVFAQGKHCTAIQHALNVFTDAPAMLALCQEYDLAGIIKSPLRSGFLTGKFGADSSFPADDERHGMDLSSTANVERLRQIESLRGVLSRNGRSMAQGALGWIWARSDGAIPIPGFKTVGQVEDNAGAMQFGPLEPDEMCEIDALLNRVAPQ